MPEAVVDGVPVLMKEERPTLVPFIKLTSRKTKKKILNPRQIVALQKYAEMGANPKNKKAAGLAAGYTPDSAVQSVNRALQHKPIVDELEKVGVTNKRIAEKILEGLGATHPLSKENKKDFNAIAKFVSEANKIKNNYPAKKIEVEERGIIVHLSADDEKSIEEFYKIRNRT